MIDITRNIVVTAENVEGILFVLHNFKLHESLNTVIAGQTAWIPVDEFDLTPQERWIAAQKRLLRVQDLIDRIELVKGDLDKGSNSRFHTDTTKYNYCSDAHWFIAPSYMNNNRSVWMFEE